LGTQRTGSTKTAGAITLHEADFFVWPLYTGLIMIVDGKAIAQGILESVKERIARRGNAPHLMVFSCVPNFETQKFLTLKQQRAAEVGVTMTVTEFPATLSEADMCAAITAAHADCDGIIVQLPFPPQVNIAPVLACIQKTHDVDALQYQGEDTNVLPPVVGAIDAIATLYSLSWTNKNVVVVGSGRLVGAPSALYARSKGAQVTVLGKESSNPKELIQTADIVILGAGVPGLVTAQDVVEGVVVFDAATSEEGGVLVGDATPEVAHVASLITPVPGGIGPITIAILLQNLVRLTSNE
jgi:methylenetetrahydrofolate dehydrogenase (NADP+) / methenyltetrahydrofolate cyclohydrolase